MDFSGRHVVVTGGTGVLGAAVVGELLAAGAACHVPNFIAAELEGFPHAGDGRVSVATGIDLADEDAVGSFYAALPGLWASIHVAGGFAMAPLADTGGSGVSRADGPERAELISLLPCRRPQHAGVRRARAGASSTSRRGPPWSRGRARA